MRTFAQHPFKNFGLKQALAICSAALLSVLIFTFHDSLYRLAPLGYAGVFLISLIGNATLILPAPVLVFVYTAGGSLPSPLLVGVLAGVGATIGELSGYLAGFGGSALIEQNRSYAKIKARVEKYGGWAVGVLAFMPNPFFDLAGIAAGTLGMRIATFLSATLIGKVAKMTLIAYAGNLSVGWVENWIL